MKAIKSLLAISVLAAAGAANAAVIATYNVHVAGTFSGAATGSLTEDSTSAELTDAGVLTVIKSGVTSTTPGGSQTIYSTYTFNGAVSGNNFTITSGSFVNTGCSLATCSANLKIGQTQLLTATPATGAGGGLFTENPFNIALGGDYHSTVKALNGFITNPQTWTFTNTTPAPAVPVPAAAWLFGSGLLGLAGTARRRRSA